jgi:hypothetical protein
VSLSTALVGWRRHRLETRRVRDACFLYRAQLLELTALVLFEEERAALAGGRNLLGDAAVVAATGEALSLSDAKSRERNRNVRVWARCDRKWPLNDGKIPNPNVVRVLREIGGRRVRNGLVSDLPPEIPNVPIRNFCTAVYHLRMRWFHVSRCPVEETCWCRRKGPLCISPPGVWPPMEA